jgi:ketosteroid isomerase-like protein
MHAFRLAPCLGLSLIALIACAPTTPPAADTKADETAIRGSNEDFVKAYNAGDADAVAALYAQEAVLSPADAPAVRGHDAIREYWTGDITASAASGVRFAFGPDSDVGVSGDLGWESGSLSATDKSGATVYQGKYLTLFRKTNSMWLIVRDIWNSDAPPAAPAATSAAGAAPM